MHTAPGRRAAFAVLSLLAVAALATPAFGQESSSSSAESASSVTTATGGIIVINQTPLSGLIGRWTLLKPYHLTESSKSKDRSIESWPGTYTIILEPPQGAIAFIKITRNGEELQSVNRPQTTFTLAAGETLNINIRYIFDKVGEVSVSSDPPGLQYLLEGPNAMNYEGVTPGSYTGMPLGQYSVKYSSPEGCPPTPVKSSQLQENKRVSFDVKLECEAAIALREQHQALTDSFVTIVVDGEQIPLTDVPLHSWFATFVFDAAKGGMVSGYKDEFGNFTGLFGPDNPVTVAELAKMSHRIGGVQEGDIEEVSNNPNVPAEAWFAQYMASAEHRGWTIYADANIDPLRPATRAEVIVTLLQALDVPVRWPKGEIFTDVDWSTQYGGAIETAAADEVVTGKSDANGKPTGLFEPQAPVNRAEMSAILVRAADAYRKGK